MLVVGTKADAQEPSQLQDAIAILLPLSVQDVGTELADPLGILRRTVGAAYGGQLQTALVDATASGASAVESTFRELLMAELVRLEEPDVP